MVKERERGCVEVGGEEGSGEGGMIGKVADAWCWRRFIGGGRAQKK